MSRNDVRMYEQKFPEVDDVVMVQVKSIAESGAYVSLLEYNGIEGMILLSELSRRRIRSITKLIKVGRQEPVMVLRVDKEKGYIDLSKRRVAPEDLKSCDDHFNKSKMVHSIVRHVAETTGVSLLDIQEQITWPLYRKYGHAFEAFKEVCQKPDEILGGLTMADGTPITALTEEVKDALVKAISRKMTPQALKIRADVEMTCFNYDGILHIQAAMRAAEASGSEECPVKMKLVAPPLYVLTTNTLDKNLGIQVLEKACEVCQKSISESKGRMVIKEAARAVSDRDDRLLTEQLEQLEAANREVGGDDDDSDEEEVEGMGDVDVDGPALTEM